MKLRPTFDCGYNDVICRYFQTEFPTIFKSDTREKLEILTALLFGTKEVRYGTLPSPESAVEIRKVLASAIEKQLPIPVLIPFGGRKTDSKALVDIAEVSAIKQLVNLDRLIRTIHPQGLQINIGIEDLGASWLYRNESTEIESDIEKYSSDLSKLIQILKGSTNITPIRESELMDREKYFTTSNFYSKLLLEVFMEQAAFPNKNLLDIQAYNTLYERGWKGDISKGQKEYYFGRYKSLYDCSDEEAYRMLADYFGGAKARYDLDGKGLPSSEVEGCIKLSFVPPVPNSPMHGATIYYRTMPASSARTHIAAWRGKGYLKIDGNDVTPKLISFNDKETLSQLQSGSIVISNNTGLEVEVSTDYLIVN